MTGADAAGACEIVVEDEAKRAAAADVRKAMRRAWRNDEEVARPRPAPPSADGLHALAREVENQLGKGVAVERNLGVAVAVELQFAQHEAERVNFDLLDQDGAPGEHGVGFVLAKVGFVLTQARPDA